MTSHEISIHPEKQLWKCLDMMDKLEQHSLTIQFLWSFDHNNGKFYWNEHAYFSFSTLKTKILFYYSQRQSSSSTSKRKDEADKFISDLYLVSKSLSNRPKFQLILISIAYLGYWATKYVIPLFQEQKEVKGYFHDHEIKSIEAKNERKFLVSKFLWRLLVHFEMDGIFEAMKELIPKAVEMELFVLSDSSRDIDSVK